jgi:glycosyltransferase involved in cell wall biosynthesis
MEILDPADPEAFARTLASLAASAERRETLGTAARELVSDFDWSNAGTRRVTALLNRFGLPQS